MKRKIIWSLLLLPALSNAQVFEKEIEATANQGTISLRESTITKTQSTTTYCSAGFYYYNEASGGYYRPVLYNRDADGTTNFNNSYILNGPSSGTYNARSYAVTEDSVSGFITVGSISNNGANTVTGGSDILLMKYNSNGQIINAKRIDFGYEEVGYDIINTDTNYNKFIICGEAKRGGGLGSEAFIAEIDRNLNVNWVKHMALKIGTTQTFAPLHAVTVDANGNIWGVGNIFNVASFNGDFLLVKLNSSGNYLYAERFYNSSDKEILYDVSLETSGKLLITGRSSTGTFILTHRLFVGMYNPSTQTLSSTKILRTPNGNGFRSNIGYEIIQTSTTPSKFIVAGTSEASNITAGLIYGLDANFSIEWQTLLQYQTSVQLFDVDHSTNGGNDYLNFSGLLNDNYTYNKGYDVKSDLTGFTGCFDTIPADSATINLTIGTLSDSVYTDYNVYTIDSTQAVLTDSFKCDTSLAKNMHIEFSPIVKSELVSYPNPVKKGNDFIIISEEDIEMVNILTITGYQVYNKKFNETKEVNINTGFLNNGIYLIYIKNKNNDMISKQKLIVIN